MGEGLTTPGMGFWGAAGDKALGRMRRGYREAQAQAAGEKAGEQS